MSYPDNPAQPYRILDIAYEVLSRDNNRIFLKAL